MKVQKNGISGHNPYGNPVVAFPLPKQNLKIKSLGGFFHKQFMNFFHIFKIIFRGAQSAYKALLSKFAYKALSKIFKIGKTHFTCTATTSKTQFVVKKTHVHIPHINLNLHKKHQNMAVRVSR